MDATLASSLPKSLRTVAFLVLWCWLVVVEVKIGLLWFLKFIYMGSLPLVSPGDLHLCGQAGSPACGTESIVSAPGRKRHDSRARISMAGPRRRPEQGAFAAEKFDLQAGS